LISILSGFSLPDEDAVSIAPGMVEITFGKDAVLFLYLSKEDDGWKILTFSFGNGLQSSS